jgi:YidC/Oxa1 family membrane protein insertase
MRFLPLVFGIVLLRFPAGLFVYWVTSNVISIFQNLLIYRNAPKPGVAEDEPKPADADRPADDGHRAETATEVQPQSRPASKGAQRSKTKKKGKAKKRR